MVAGGTGSVTEGRGEGARGSHPPRPRGSGCERCPFWAGSEGMRCVPEPCLGSAHAAAPTFGIPPPGARGWDRRWSPHPKGGFAESAGLGQLVGSWGRAGRRPPGLSLKLGLQRAPDEPAEASGAAIDFCTF